ncbi:hypothetical protein [Alsobacter metallidurans]|nr:hypothetical protein [Alsobacter metallidurans]
MTSLLPAAFAAMAAPLVTLFLVLMVARAWDAHRSQPARVRVVNRARQRR